MRRLLAVTIFMLSTSSASAGVILDISPAGILLGAQGVIIDGMIYNVEFLDGNCVDDIPGCGAGAGELVPFTLVQVEDALLNQVLKGIFDTDPTRTAGCATATEECRIVTYQSLDVLAGFVASMEVLNYSAMVNAPFCDFTLTSGDCARNDIEPIPTGTTSGIAYTLARWTKVASVVEPGALTLTGFGLLLLGLMRKGKRFDLS